MAISEFAVSPASTNSWASVTTSAVGGNTKYGIYVTNANSPRYTLLNANFYPYSAAGSTVIVELYANTEGQGAGDPNTETPPAEGTEEDKDTAVKNYNIRLKFKKLAESISDILTNLSSIIYHNPIQNQVLERGIDNIQTIKEQIISYMEFNLSSDYKTNLYYYTTFIQALQLNLDMLTKNSKMSIEDTKNKNNK